MNVSPLHPKHQRHLPRVPTEPLNTSLLLKLEWMLLGFTGLMLSLMVPFVPKLEFAALSLVSVVALALIRLLRAPRQVSAKVAYTTLEILFVSLPSFIDGGPPFFPLLGLVIVMRGCQRFRLPGRLAVSGFTFGVFALTLLSRPGNPPNMLLELQQAQDGSALQSFNMTVWMLKFNVALTFGLALLLVMLLINALLEERQSRARLVLALDQLRQYSLRIEDQSALQERNRIAREIHDSLGHTLTAQSIQLDSALLLQHSNQAEAHAFLQEAKQLCKQALEEVRHSVTALRADPLRGKSLTRVATTLIQEFQVTTTIGLNCTVAVACSVSPDVTAAMYRVLQESLTNIVRHSVATEVTITLLTQEGLLHLRVQDNGKGFDPTQNSTGFGLQGMQERIAALGGQFEVSSQPGEGCLISAQVPLVLQILA